MTNSKEYNKAYYEMVAKPKLKEFVRCETCNKNYKRWNFGHHVKTEKHRFNLLSEEEKEIHQKLRIMELQKRWLTKDFK